MENQIILEPLLRQGFTLLQLSRQVEPVMIAGARHSLAPTERAAL